MTIYYADIASFQAGLDMAGLLVVVAKATQGTGYTNPEYGPFRTEAAKHGTFFLSYHFLNAGSAAAQAQHAHAVAGNTALMLDVEPDPSISSRPSMGDTTQFIDAYRQAGGTCYMVYLPRWYWAEMGSPSLAPLASRGVMLVSSNYGGYTDASWGAGWQGYGGMVPSVWQYTSSMRFNRQTIDFNAFRGHYAGKQDPASVAACLAEFKALVSTGKEHTGPVDPPPAAYRNVVPSGYGLSLAELAKQRNTTAARLAAFSLNFMSEGNDAIMRDYIALDKSLRAQGRPHPVMPEGMVYWTKNPVR